jgi:hypothetical protein
VLEIARAFHLEGKNETNHTSNRRNGFRRMADDPVYWPKVDWSHWLVVVVGSVANLDSDVRGVGIVCRRSGVVDGVWREEMKDDSGPAFPLPDQYTPQGTPVMQGHPGMTLRDWFAGQALAGILSDPNIHGPSVLSIVPREAYEIADAMLSERKKWCASEIWLSACQIASTRIAAVILAMMTALRPGNGGTMIQTTRRLQCRILAKGAQTMQKLTDDQVKNVDRAEHELRRRLQQMIGTGQHSHGAVKEAMQRILEGWGWSPPR